MKSRQCILTPSHDEKNTNRLCALAIMTKAPRAGEVKTRLTPPLTNEEAASLNICFLRDIANAILAAGEGIGPIGCYTPADAAGFYQEILPSEFQLLPQRGSDLTERLVFAAEDLFAIGFSSVCLIGSDTPTVPAAVYSEAVRMLSLPNDRVVLGRAEDGGYYLIGLKTLHRSLFEGINWSTGTVFEETVSRARELELPVHLLPQSYDIDDYLALGRLCCDLLDFDESGKEINANATRAFLHEIISREGRTRICPL